MHRIKAQASKIVSNCFLSCYALSDLANRRTMTFHYDVINDSRIKTKNAVNVVASTIEINALLGICNFQNQDGVRSENN